MSKFAETLSYLIFEQGMDGKSFAEKLGVTPSCITRYTSDIRSPSVEYLILIADYFNCSTDYLLGLEEKQDLTFKSPSPFSERLQFLLDEFHNTGKTLSDETGVHISSIYSWKSGKRVPTVDNILKISKFLDRRVDYILGRES